jgi:ribosomal protein L6P/L9E
MEAIIIVKPKKVSVEVQFSQVRASGEDKEMSSSTSADLIAARLVELLEIEPRTLKRNECNCCVPSVQWTIQ